MITVLALDDSGSPCFDHGVAANFSALGVPSFACTPDLFPDLMGNALPRRDVNQWAQRRESRSSERR